MGLLVYLILIAVGGLIVGGLARLALPGPDPMSLPQTMFVGIGGSLIAGVIIRVLFNATAPGLVISVLAATGIVYLIRRRGGGPPVRPWGSRR
jgi:uncharacterized membrane protein YeaQ/YmgE (transglycosylase-associated protein family)